jgi:hypothetical protein
MQIASATVHIAPEPPHDADRMAAAMTTSRGMVLTGDQAARIGDLLAAHGGVGSGAAVHVLAVYWADRTAEVIAFRQASGDLPASVLAIGEALDDVLITAMIDCGTPAPDCPAIEAVVSEVMELVTRRMCAERAGLAAGGLNRILYALETVEDNDDPDGTFGGQEALSRLADRIADLAGGTVAEPGGIGFTVE